jgi:ubiquinone/menaquinone biosynthesis C-methylase UbiE
LSEAGGVAVRGRVRQAGPVNRVGRAALVLAVLLLTAGFSPQSDPPAPAAARPVRPASARENKGTRAKGRLFEPLDLGLLESPDREQWQKPDQIMDALLIAEGSVVADLGAGGGWFTIKLARRVGPNGLVYAEDIQREMIEAIGRRVQREGQPNVQTVLGTSNDPGLPPGIDAVLIVDVYHEIDDPVTLLTHVAESLNPQGRLGVVVFNPGGGGPGPPPDERVAPDTVIKEASAAGLQLIAREPVPPFQVLLVFGRSTSHQSAGIAPAATSSLSRSAAMKGVTPTAKAPRRPRGAPAKKVSPATPPAKTSARPQAMAATDVR